VSIQPNGFVTFTPGTSFLDSVRDSFVVTISDGLGGTYKRTINVNSFTPIGVYGYGYQTGDGWWSTLCYGQMRFSGNWAYFKNLDGWAYWDIYSSTIWTQQFGMSTPSGNNGWMLTATIGWIWIGDIKPGWVWSPDFGWVKPAGDGYWFYSNNLKGWIGAMGGSTFWSGQFGTLTTAGSNNGLFNTSALGWISTGDYGGYVWSSRFGWVLPVGDSGTIYWSTSYGWLSANGAGAVWSASTNGWL
jgi:hypothetical protein